MSRVARSVIVVGCGPHYRDRYHSVLDEHLANAGLEISLAVDLESRRHIVEGFFAASRLVPQHFLFIPDNEKNACSPQQLDKLVRAKVGDPIIDGVIICTEPRYHKLYLLWAINRDWSCFVDKPLTAPALDSPRGSVLKDFEEILALSRQRSVNVVMQCERRMQLGYRWAFKYLTEFITEYKVPITHIDVHFAGGKWIFPHEWWLAENHPFKYGYGSLFHSGYHYVDLLAQLLALNGAGYKEPKIFVDTTFPDEVVATMGAEIYATLFPGADQVKDIGFSASDTMRGFGEVDVMICGTHRPPAGPFTQFTLTIRETSVSNRSMQHIPQEYLLGFRDPDVAWGRGRQEQVTIHLGPLMSLYIRTHSLDKHARGPSTPEAFSIEIHKNSAALGGHAYQCISRTRISEIYKQLPVAASLNVFARREQLREFLNGGHGNSALHTHAHSIRLFSQIADEIARIRDERLSTSRFRLVDDCDSAFIPPAP